MKKILILLSIVALFCCCSKQDVLPEPEEVEVSFSFNIAETGTISTRAFSDEVLPTLKYEYPKKVYLWNSSTCNYTLDLEKSDHFYIKQGEYVAYSRKGDEGNLDSRFYSSDKVPLEIHDIGIYSFKEFERTLGYNITIDKSKCQTLEVRFAAIVIACKKDKVSYFKWRSAEEYPDWSNINLQSSGDYYYYILTVPDDLVLGGDEYSQALTVEMGGTETTETTQVTVDIVKSSRGKYFVFSPDEKDCKTFDMSIVDYWKEENYE